MFNQLYYTLYFSLIGALFELVSKAWNESLGILRQISRSVVDKFFVFILQMNAEIIFNATYGDSTTKMKLLPLSTWRYDSDTRRQI